MKLLKKGDIIIAVAVIITAAALFSNSIFKGNSKHADIYQNGELMIRHNLSEDGMYELEGLVIVINQGYAYVLEADCPDKLCVKTGRIHQTHQIIACVPNRIVIIISSDEEEYKGVDAIAE